MELLKFSRKILQSHFENTDLIIPKEIKEKYSSKKSCFVTLNLKNELRGCIGSLKSDKPLYEDLINNTISAAFKDPRFPSLEKNELEKIKIEISILSEPKKIEYTDEKDLLNKINKNNGVILKKGFYSATFLPQVWEEISDKIKFMEFLSRKAGLEKDEWKNSEIWIYTAEVLKEK